MIGKTLARLFEISHYATRVNAQGITDAEALIQPPPDGNCMNWVVGHIVASREGMLKLLGEPPVLASDVAARYTRGAAPITGEGDGLPLSEFLAALATSQERLLRGIENATEEKWAEPVPDYSSVKGAAHFIHFHEAYHAGQVALLRRMAGKAGAIK